MNKSMAATTIAEVSVSDGQVQVDLEIGARDLSAFVNVLPDELLQRLDHDPGSESPAERHRRFFSEDFVVRADGEPLVGQVIALEARPRLKRDDVTGEPLDVQPDDQPLIVHLVAAFDLPVKPKSITLQPPVDSDSGLIQANIGFILFHRGLPVTDFRYLGQAETVDLDWQDPWYSRFRNPNLKRHFDSPLSVFLYVEHFEVRLEVVARPRDLQDWVDLGIRDQRVLEVADQAELKHRVTELLSSRLKLVVNGSTLTPELDRIHFIRRTLRQTGVIDPPEPMDLTSATLGVILICPTDGLPEQVSVEWPFFSDRISAVPVVATDQAGGLPGQVTPSDPLIVWKNFLTNPVTPAMLEIPAPKRRPAWRTSIPSAVAVLLACGAAVTLYRRWPQNSGKAGPALVLVCAVIAIGLSYFGQVSLLPPFTVTAEPEPAQQEQLVEAILHNIYRAFDRRGESVVFDQLSQSVSGDLLEQVYLEFRQALELANQGGAQASVESVAVVGHETLPDAIGTSGFRSRVTWTVAGAVGHWGHIHRRSNQYTADLAVAVTDDRWKITDLRISDSTPIDSSAVLNE